MLLAPLRSLGCVVDELGVNDLAIGLHLFDLSVVVEHFHFLKEILFETAGLESLDLGGPFFVVLGWIGPRALLALGRECRVAAAEIRCTLLDVGLTGLTHLG